MSRNLQSLLAVAAEMRAVGHPWEVIADQVRRKTRTCQQWPRRYCVAWQPLYRTAQQKRFDEISNEAASHLQALMRSKEDKTRIKASEVWMRCGAATWVARGIDTTPPDPELEEARARLAAEKEDRDRVRRSIDAGRRQAGLPPLTDEEADDVWALICAGGGRTLSHRTIRYMEERFRHSVRWHGALRDWPKPLSLAWGMRDPVATENVLNAVLELRPHAPVTRLADLGHYPQIEDPVRVASELQRALSG